MEGVNRNSDGEFKIILAFHLTFDLTTAPASSPNAVKDLGRLSNMDQQLEAGPSSGPHRMRITSGGSIPSYVKFAVGFLLVCQFSRLIALV